MKSGGYSPALPFSPGQYAKQEDQPERMAYLGEKFEKEGITYRFVKVHTTCAASVIASHAVLHYVSANVVTNDVSESATADEDSFAGIAPTLDASVPQSVSGTSTYYMLMIEPVKGDFATVTTNGDDDIAVGDYVIASGDGTCDSYLVDPSVAGAPSDAELQALQADVGARLIGVAMEADVNAANTVLVKFV